MPTFGCIAVFVKTGGTWGTSPATVSKECIDCAGIRRLPNWKGPPDGSTAAIRIRTNPGARRGDRSYE
jgi:hypothetical protein